MANKKQPLEHPENWYKPIYSRNDVFNMLQEIRSLDVSSTGVSVLMLVNSGVDNSADISKHLGLDGSPGSVSGIINKLKKAGYLLAKPNKEANRGFINRLSAKASRKLGRYL